MHGSFAHVMDARAFVGIVFAMTATAMMLVTGDARADAGETSDVRALEKQLDQEHSALSTADCEAACRALGSIRRAADRICALEPGLRCDSARAKAADATRRVRDACPECAIAAGPPAPNDQERAAAATTPRETVDRAPAPAESRGGCRSCSATDSTGLRADLAMIVLTVFGLSRVLSGRRKKDRSAV